VTQYNLPQDILDIIQDQSKRIEKLEKLVQTGSTSIDDGALEVREAGVTKVKVGKLDSGAFGLAVYNNAGLALPLSQLAFGLKAASDAPLVSAPLNTWTAGPTVTGVEITTGRMVVIVSAALHTYATSPPGFSPTTTGMSYTIIGPTTVAADMSRAVTVELTTDSIRGDYMQGSFVYVHDSLPVGTYVVSSQYSRLAVGSFPGAGELQYRSIVVLPY
jgi:hypothetical protein